MSIPEYLNYANAACPECGTGQFFTPAMLEGANITCARCGAVFVLSFHSPDAVFLHTENGIVEMADGPLATMLAAHAIPPHLKCLSIDRVHWATFDELIRGATHTRLVQAASRMPESSMETAVDPLPDMKMTEIPPPATVVQDVNSIAVSAPASPSEETAVLSSNDIAVSAPALSSEATAVLSSNDIAVSVPSSTRPENETNRTVHFQFSPPSPPAMNARPLWLDRFKNLIHSLKNKPLSRLNLLIAFSLSLLTLLTSCLPQLFASPFRRIVWWEGTRLLFFFDRPAGAMILLLALAGAVLATANAFPKIGRILPPFPERIQRIYPAAYGAILVLGMLELVLIRTQTVKILHPTPWFYAMLFLAAATGVFQLLTVTCRQHIGEK